MNKHIFQSNHPFTLEQGDVLPSIKIAYETAGQLNANKDNVVWVCHALTGNADVFDWWGGLFGIQDYFNPDEHFIICANVLGSCYGTTGPLDADDEHSFHDFPVVTIRDMVAAHELLRQHLGIEQIHTLIGGSLGGHQALEWGISNANAIKNLILIATSARHTPWGIAYNESQRMAIESDETWQYATPKAGETGMKVARSIALISYRTYHMYNLSQADKNTNDIGQHRAISYQRYQGEKLARRFNAFSYYRLSQAMDSQNVGRNRGSVTEALTMVKAKTLVIGIDSDGLFPTTDQQYLATHILNAKYIEIQSDYGHDGFLTETKALTGIMESFFEKEKVVEKSH